jgi:hypothetical protein
VRCLGGRPWWLTGQKVNRLAYGNVPAVMMKYVKPSAEGVIGVPPPQVVAGGPPLTLTVRPSKFEQPQPFTRRLVRRQIGPVVLKLPDWLLKLTGFEHTGPLPPVNVAVTDRVAVIATVHGPVPVHAPLHPANVEPLVDVAVNVIDVPLR